MESRTEKALALKRCGTYNCAQAVACAFADTTGLDAEHLKRITQAFGAGMGTMEGSCGALVGAGVIVGLQTPDKAQAMRRMKQIMANFQARNGATQCKALKGVGRAKPLRACEGCVADAVELLEAGRALASESEARSL